jgi:hypothetical protein
MVATTTSKAYIELKKEIDEIKKSVDEQGLTINKIHQAIVGDKDFGHEGIVDIIKRHDVFIESQKNMWAKIYGGIIVGSSIIGFLVKLNSSNGRP